jgi:hypothetical protein
MIMSSINNVSHQPYRAPSSLSLSLKVLLSALFGSIQLLFTLQAEEYNDFQIWYNVNFLATLNEQKSYQFYFEVQPRLGDDVQKMERLLVRSAFVYSPKKELSFWFGYGWTPLFINQQYKNIFRDEHRLWQQVLYTQQLPWHSAVLQYRFRQEQRFIEHAERDAHRSRFMLRGWIPLIDCGEEKYGITAFDELFFNLNSMEKGPVRGFDRNRTFLGPYYENKSIRLETGYLNEYGNKFRDGNRTIQGVLTNFIFKF